MLIAVAREISTVFERDLEQLSRESHSTDEVLSFLEMNFTELSLVNLLMKCFSDEEKLSEPLKMISVCFTEKEIHKVSKSHTLDVTSRVDAIPIKSISRREFIHKVIKTRLKRTDDFEGNIPPNTIYEILHDKFGQSDMGIGKRSIMEERDTSYSLLFNTIDNVIDLFKHGLSLMQKTRTLSL